MKDAVVGGGLAGLSAALELADSGHEVVLHEARPTLGGAVQTRPRREGDPEPPPDNGQHIALDCFTEYRRFLERIGEAGSLRRLRLELPVIDERGRSAVIAPSALAVFPEPPPTVAAWALAALSKPPPATVETCPLAVLCTPPPTVANSPLAVFPLPPATVACR